MRPISNQTCPALPMVTQRWPLIVQQWKLLRLAVSDYIDRIADGRGLRQRVITQPRPKADLAADRFRFTVHISFAEAENSGFSLRAEVVGRDQSRYPRRFAAGSAFQRCAASQAMMLGQIRA